MGTREALFLMAGLTVVALTGCKKSPQPTTVPIVIQGDAVSKEVIEKVLKANLTVISPHSGTEYTIRVVEPNPSIDYKIAMVQPDPNIDYKIMIVDPQSGKEVPGLSQEIAGAILKAMKERKEKR